MIECQYKHLLDGYIISNCEHGILWHNPFFFVKAVAWFGTLKSISSYAVNLSKGSEKMARARALVKVNHAWIFHPVRARQKSAEEKF